MPAGRDDGAAKPGLARRGGDCPAGPEMRAAAGLAAETGRLETLGAVRI
jgi:hypothetical protein